MGSSRPPFPPRLSIPPMFSGDKAKIGLVLCLNDPRLSKTSHRHSPSLSCILAFWILYYSTPYTLTLYLYTYITYLLNMATGRLRLANKVSSCWRERNELIVRFASSLVLDRKSYRGQLPPHASGNLIPPRWICINRSMSDSQGNRSRDCFAVRI